MVVTRISPKYMLQIPEEFRKALPAGQEVVISVDRQGRIVITPVEKVHAALAESFGIWADRTDLPDDAIDYVREIRKGYRVDNVRADTDEAD